MFSKPSFECPVCSGYRYEAIAAADPGEDPGRPRYACSCCGFSFVDPARYRHLFVPYSTLRRPARTS